MQNVQSTAGTFSQGCGIGKLLQSYRKQFRNIDQELKYAHTPQSSNFTESEEIFGDRAIVNVQVCSLKHYLQL